MVSQKEKEKEIEAEIKFVSKVVLPALNLLLSRNFSTPESHQAAIEKHLRGRDKKRFWQLLPDRVSGLEFTVTNNKQVTDIIVVRADSETQGEIWNLVKIKEYLTNLRNPQGAESA